MYGQQEGGNNRNTNSPIFFADPATAYPVNSSNTTQISGNVI